MPILTPQQYRADPSSYWPLRDPITGVPALNDQGYYVAGRSGYPQKWWSDQDFWSSGTPAPPWAEPTPIPNPGWIEAGGFPGMFGTPEAGQSSIGEGFDRVAPEGSVGSTVAAEPTPIPGNVFPQIPFDPGTGLGTGASAQGTLDDPWAGWTSGSESTGEPTVQINPGTDPLMTQQDLSQSPADVFANLSEPTVELNPVDPTQIPSPEGWVNGMPPLNQPPNQPAIDPSTPVTPQNNPIVGYSPTGEPIYASVATNNFGGPGTFQAGTYIPTGSPGYMYGTNWGNGSFSFTGVPGTTQTTGSGQAFSTALGFSMDPNQQGDVYTGVGGEQLDTGDIPIFGYIPSRIPWLPGRPIYNPKNPRASVAQVWTPNSLQAFGSQAPSAQDMAGVGGKKAG